MFSISRFGCRGCHTATRCFSRRTLFTSEFHNLLRGPPHGLYVSSSVPTVSRLVKYTVMSAQQGHVESEAVQQHPAVMAAVAQMTACGDQDENFTTCQGLAEDARRQGASMLFLPECFSFIGMSPQEAVAAAQPLDGPIMARYRELARQTGMWLSLGGFQEQGPDESHLYNCHVILSSAGEVVAAYRKVHLFDVDVPDGPILMESRSTAPGSQLVACDSPVGRLGLTVCYDLRFPEVYQRLAFDMGAQVLLVPSAFTKVTGEAHWEVLLRARAIESQCYVIAAAQAGQHNGKRQSYGHSLIIDPWGRIVARLSDPEGTGVALAPIDLTALANIRTRMPIAEHRKRGRASLGLVDEVHEPAAEMANSVT